MEGCQESVILFDNPQRRQFYTIAFAQDDDFYNTSNQMIEIAKDKVKKLEKNAFKNAARIKEQNKTIEKMRKTLQDEMEQRYLFVNENQMISIPYDLGITGTVFAKNKSVYFNEFEGSAFFV